VFPRGKRHAQSRSRSNAYDETTKNRKGDRRSVWRPRVGVTAMGGGLGVALRGRRRTVMEKKVGKDVEKSCLKGRTGGGGVSQQRISWRWKALQASSCQACHPPRSASRAGGRDRKLAPCTPLCALPQNSRAADTSAKYCCSSAPKCPTATILVAARQWAHCAAIRRRQMTFKIQIRATTSCPGPMSFPPDEIQGADQTLLIQGKGPTIA